MTRTEPKQLSLQLEFQENPLIDEVSAITAIVRPILTGLLHSLKQDVVSEAGGLDDLKLKMLPRVYRQGDGDVGICFEYAVHDAIRDHNPLILDRVETALTKCRIPTDSIESILFGAEKSGSLNLIDTASELLTPDAVLLHGSKGRPVKLLSSIRSIASALRRPSVREQLPQSISGLWKADLFTGDANSQKWVGTTLKINRSMLEGAKGLRIGIVPASDGESDAVYLDDKRNLVVCPLPYDRSFMQAFYQAWEVVRQFLHSDAKVPSNVALPRPQSRQVARYLAERRDFPVLAVIEALEPLAQPELLRTEDESASIVRTNQTEAETITQALVAPIPKEND